MNKKALAQLGLDLAERTQKRLIELGSNTSESEARLLVAMALRNAADSIVEVAANPGMRLVREAT